MTAFNWDIMPAELRRKLLELANMDASHEHSRWVSMSEYEKKSLNEALLNKTGGTANLKGME